MPMAAAATVTLNMVRILKTPLSGNNAAHDKPRVSSRVISELLRVLEKEPESSAKIKAPWPLRSLYRICIGLGDNTAMRYEILATGDRF